MKKRFAFIFIALLINGWCQSARAAELSGVCTFYKDQVTKFSTHLATSKDKNFGSYSSGLDIVNNGATLDGWQPVWCYGQSLSSQKEVRADGYFKFTVTSITNTSGLALTKSDGNGDTIPIILCLGQQKGTLQENCATAPATQITLPMNTPDSVATFNAAVLPVQDRWKNPATPNWVGLEWRIASHIRIPAGTNPSPGIYSGEVNLAMSARFRGTAGWNFNVDVDGDSQFPTTYHVYIHKDCAFLKADPVNFGTANFVNELAAATGRLSVQCTKNTSYSLKMRGDNDRDGNHDQHYMKKEGSSDEIPYQLYDGDGMKLWQYAQPNQFTGTGKTELIDITAKVNALAPEAPQGRYSDIITAELTY